MISKNLQIWTQMITYMCMKLNSIKTMIVNNNCT